MVYLFQKLKRNGVVEMNGYEVGSTYLNKYWNEKYTVLEIHDMKPFGWSDSAVTVKWESGHKTTHCTPFSKNDVKINE